MNIKKIFIFGPLLLFLMISCNATLTKEEVQKAINELSLALPAGIIYTTFGQEILGIDYDQENQLVTLQEYNPLSIEELSEENLIYTGYSGTVQYFPDEVVMDLKMEGGPVKTLRITGNRTSTLIIANEKSYSDIDFSIMP